MDKKTIYIVVAVLIVVIVVGVAGVMLLNQGGNGETSPTPTPAPVAVGEAASLQFSVDTTTDGVTSTAKYYAKGLDTNDIMFRVELPIADMGDIVYIFGTNHTVWTNESGEWADDTDNFSTQWDLWYPGFEGYIDSLVHWTEGEYTSEDGTVRIYNIIVNPTLEDSLFEPPAT